MKKPELAIVFKSMHDEYMDKISRHSSDGRGYKTFHPSSFGKCLRKTALQYYGEFDPFYKSEKFPEAKIQRLFQAGHFFHNRMQRDLADMGVLRGCWKSKISGKVYGKNEKHGILRPKTLEEIGETRLENDNRNISELFEYVEITLEDKEHNFYGHCDGIVEFPVHEEDYDEHGEQKVTTEKIVVDFKTINTDSFKLLKDPDPEYVMQINIYMWILGLNKGVIYYEDKNKHEVKEYLIHRDDKFIEEIKSNAKTLLKLLESRKLPKIPEYFSKTSSPCKYCDYLEKCWEIAEKKKKTT